MVTQACTIRRKRQEDFKASLCYTVRSSLKIKSKPPQTHSYGWGRGGGGRREGGGGRERDLSLCVDEMEDLLSFMFVVKSLLTECLCS